MNKKTRKLAKKAGFIFWENEEWKPLNETIDWSCYYDNELVKFAKLVRKDERKKKLDPPKFMTEEEKKAYAWGWWKAIEAINKKKQQDNSQDLLLKKS
jgi:hypothetical protein